MGEAAVQSGRLLDGDFFLNFSFAIFLRHVYIVNALVPGVAHSEPSGETMQAWVRPLNAVESHNLAIWFY